MTYLLLSDANCLHLKLTWISAQRNIQKGVTHRQVNNEINQFQCIFSSLSATSFYVHLYWGMRVHLRSKHLFSRHRWRVAGVSPGYRCRIADQMLAHRANVCSATAWWNAEHAQFVYSTSYLLYRVIVGEIFTLKLCICIKRNDN